MSVDDAQLRVVGITESGSTAGLSLVSFASAPAARCFICGGRLSAGVLVVGYLPLTSRETRYLHAEECAVRFAGGAARQYVEVAPRAMSDETGVFVDCLCGERPAVVRIGIALMSVRPGGISACEYCFVDALGAVEHWCERTDHRFGPSAAFRWHPVVERLPAGLMATPGPVEPAEWMAYVEDVFEAAARP